MDVKISGAEILGKSEKEILDRILGESSDKITRKIKGDFSMKVFVKEHSKGGKSKKYSLDVEVISSKNVLKATAYDWDFKRTMHKVLNKIINEAEHRFHASEQGRKTGIKKGARFLG